MLNGYQKKQDYESRERWQIARKIMWASMALHSKKKVEEKDIIVFPWEQQMLETVEREFGEEYLAELEQTRKFWDEYDAKNNK